MVRFKAAIDPLVKIITSSAKARCVMTGQPIGTRNPTKLCCDAREFSPRDSIFEPIIKSTGDSGSPCRNPLLDLKYPCDVPLITIENHMLEISRQTRSINRSPKPNARNMIIIGLQDIRSYALLISSFRATFPPLAFLPMVDINS